MVKTIFKIIRFVTVLVIIPLIVSLANFTAIREDYEGLKRIGRFDLLNRFKTYLKVNDITEMIPQTEIKRDETLFLILHHDGIDIKKHSPILDILKFHTENKGWKSIGYHFYINKNGIVYQMHDIEAKTSHCINENNFSLGICLEGNFNNIELEGNQRASLILLFIKLLEKYPEAVIFGHNEFANKDCPGKNINIDTISDEVYNFHYFNFL